MANNNKPIWKDYPLQVSGGTYVIKEYVNGSWVTRRTFHALATPDGSTVVAVNNMLCNDLKTGFPEDIGITTHSDAWRRYECQTGATTGATEAFNFCQDWSWEDWDGEQRALSCPINGHADMRQRLFRSRFGELSEDIEIKALVRPNFSYYYIDSVAAETTSGFITVTANEDYTINCSAAWIGGLSGLTGDTGEQTFSFYIQPNTGFTDRSATIEVTYLNFEQEYETHELPLTQRAVVPFFNVSPVEKFISWASGTAAFVANTNVPFTASDNQSWIEYSGKTQAGYNAWNVSFNVSANIGEPREAVITFTYPTSTSQSGTTSVVVRQGEKQIVCEELWYLSTNGAVVQPAFTGTYYFGANILSNTYNDGQGIILFDNCVTKLGTQVFQNKTTLSDMTIPDSVTEIGNAAFYGTALSSLTIPNSVTSIGVSAFTQCTILSSVTIGSGVTVIPKYAFSGCTNLSSIVIPNSVTKIDTGAFKGCKKINVLNIPDSVTNIEGDTFTYCNISSVTIGSGVTILHDIFQNCSISAITIGSKVQQIYDDTFIFSNVGYINVASGNTTFYSPNNCNAIMSRDYNTITVGGYRTVIPDFATSIGERAFMGCAVLSSITIPDSITAIRRQGFAYCSNLSTINYNGTKTQWGTITKGSGWHTNVPATVVHCTDGDSSLD